MKILILGAYCSCNLGDAVICQCTAHLLHQRYPHAQLEIRDLIERDRRAPRRVPEIRQLRKRWLLEQGRKAVSCLGWDKVLSHETARVAEQNAYIEKVCSEGWDLCIIAGGQLYMDRYSLFLKAYNDRLKSAGVPVFFNACGTGPAYSRAVGQQMQTLLLSENIAYISCRDHADLVDIRYVKGKKPVISVQDPALFTKEVFGISKKESQVLGLGIMYPWGILPVRALRFWRRLIRQLDRQGIAWEFFTNGDWADIAFARQVLEKTAWNPDEKIRTADIEPEQLVETISRYRALISFRLHSHIIAHSLGIPSIAVVWDDKLPCFFQAMGHPERCISVNTAPATVISLLKTALQEGCPSMMGLAENSRDRLYEAIEQVLPQLRELP